VWPGELLVADGPPPVLQGRPDAIIDSPGDLLLTLRVQAVGVPEDSHGRQDRIPAHRHPRLAHEGAELGLEALEVAVVHAYPLKDPAQPLMRFEPASLRNMLPATADMLPEFGERQLRGD
jgi:hypothetical protein